MKVIYIIPGSGGTFYCQNCLRDFTVVKALRARGLDVVILPMYLPMFAGDTQMRGDTPIFYGAINCYLEQKLSLFRNMPRWLDKLFDAKPVLDWAAKKSASTNASGLEAMTLSMLQGEDGRQAKELDRLIAWLRDEGKPDMVHLSNALLLGLARRIKDELDVPIYCALQDEDHWLDAMDGDKAQAIWDVMGDRAKSVDRFIAVSQYFADKMRTRIGIPNEKMSVVHIGVDPALYDPSPLSCDPPVLGYLSRLSPVYGLDLLVKAFLLLKQEPRFKTLTLRATGGQLGADRAFVKALRRHIAKAGHAADVTFLDNYEVEQRPAFLKNLTLMSVPVPNGEAFGLFMVEAFAAGVPVVQPRTGAFAEIIERSGGGVVYDPNTPEALAKQLAILLDDPEQIRALAGKSRAAVVKHFSLDAMAQKTEAIYRDHAKQ